MSTTKTLCFYTLGPEFTVLLRDLWRDKPQAALQIMFDGSPTMTLDLAVELFTGKRKFVGDSRDEDGMTIVPDDSTSDYAGLEETTARFGNQYKEACRQYFLALERAMHPLRFMKAYTVEELAEEAEDARIRAERLHKQFSEYCVLAKIKEVVSPFPFLGIQPYQPNEWTEGEATERENDYRESVGQPPLGMNLQQLSPAASRNAERVLGRLAEQQQGMATGDKLAVANALGLNAKFLDLDRYIDQAKGEQYTLSPSPLLESPHESGYIDRAGQLYGCGDRWHVQFAPLLCEHLNVENDGESRDPDTLLCRAGFVKFSMERFLYYPAHRAGIDTPSGEQVDVIVAWANAHGEDGVPGTLQYNGQEVTVAQFLEQTRP